jgi:hypothetical protein
VRILKRADRRRTCLGDVSAIAGEQQGELSPRKRELLQPAATKPSTLLVNSKRRVRGCRVHRLMVFLLFVNIS